MMIEVFAIKCFSLGVFFTWFIMKKLNKKPTTYEIREI